MRGKQNEMSRHLADQFEFAFLDDNAGVRLFQGGVKVCRGEQQHGQGNQVYRQGKASPIGQQKHQTHSGRRPESGRGSGCRCPSGRGFEVPGGQGS